MNKTLLFTVLGGVIASVIAYFIVGKLSSTGTPGAAQAASAGNAYPAIRVRGGYLPGFTGTKQPQRDIYSTQPQQLQSLSS
jgi:hypothetical protein